MKLCEYGCGQEARFQFKNGKWCCSKNWQSCPAIRKKISLKVKKVWKDPNNKYNSISCKEKRSNSMKKARKNTNNNYNSTSYKEKQSSMMKKIWGNPDSKLNLLKLTIEKIKEKYPIFTKEEETRYNPNKLNEIQIHCKNHNCQNSKEKKGWFTPTYIQLYERIRQLENEEGNDGSYFYCSQECKDECSLYNIHEDPYKNNILPYTSSEYQTFRTFVLERDNYICQFCGEPATHVHHERPQKIEPFFALDPDFAWSCCEKCHYKKGHQAECSTGNLAKIICSVESQKFLEQKI